MLLWSHCLSSASHVCTFPLWFLESVQEKHRRDARAVTSWPLPLQNVFVCASFDDEAYVSCVSSGHFQERGFFQMKLLTDWMTRKLFKNVIYTRSLVLFWLINVCSIAKSRAADSALGVCCPHVNVSCSVSPNKWKSRGHYPLHCAALAALFLDVQSKHEENWCVMTQTRRGWEC